MPSQHGTSEIATRIDELFTDTRTRFDIVPMGTIEQVLFVQDDENEPEPCARVYLKTRAGQFYLVEVARLKPEGERLLRKHLREKGPAR